MLDWNEWQARFESLFRPAGGFDPDSWLALFAESGRYYTPLFPTIHGPDRVLKTLAETVPDWALMISSRHSASNGAALEWTMSGHFMGVIPVTLHGCSVIEIDEAGLVTRWSDYVDGREWDSSFRIG